MRKPQNRFQKPKKKEEKRPARPFSGVMLMHCGRREGGRSAGWHAAVAGIKWWPAPACMRNKAPCCTASAPLPSALPLALSPRPSCRASAPLPNVVPLALAPRRRPDLSPACRRR